MPKKAITDIVDRLINCPAIEARLGAGEILRLREGVHGVIDDLRAGRDAEFCARRLECLLGVRMSLNDKPVRRGPPRALRVPKPKAPKRNRVQA